MNIAIHFEIPVQDLTRAIRFYEALFEITLERAQIDGNEMALFLRIPTHGDRSITFMPITQ